LTATLTATSADDGCGRWVVRIVVLAAEGVAQGVGGSSPSLLAVSVVSGLPRAVLRVSMASR
jgi:hypothetical protein